MDIPKFYIANVLLLDSENQTTDILFMGLYAKRENAYNGIQTGMSHSPNSSWIPQVRVGEVLDADAGTYNMWSEILAKQ